MLKRTAWLALFSAAWIAAHGCAARSGAAAYRLLAQNDQYILVPPGVKDAGVKQRTFDFSTAADARACSGRDGGVDLQPRRRGGLRLTVDRDSLEQQLAVKKPYDGRLAPVEFSRATPDILALPLAGGEEIRW